MENHRRYGDTTHLECAGERRFVVNIIEDKYLFLGDNGAKRSGVFQGECQRRGKGGQPGQLVSSYLQAIRFFQCVDRGTAVGDNGSNLVQNQVEEWFQLQSRGDALRNFQDGG